MTSTVATRVAHAERVATASEDQQALEQWLLGLDGGRGSLMKFIEPLQREFGSLKEVAAAYCPEEDDSTSIVNCVDPVLFEALGVSSLGHKLMLAKGVSKLAAELEDENPKDVEQPTPSASHHEEQRWQEEESPHHDTPKPKWVPPTTSRVLGPQPSSAPQLRGSTEPPTPRPTPRGSVGVVSAKVSPTSAYTNAYTLQEIAGGFMSTAETEEAPSKATNAYGAVPSQPGPKPPKCPPPAHILAKAAISRIVGSQARSAK